MFLFFNSQRRMVTSRHLLGKGLPLGSRLWYITVSLLPFNWYSGSGVVLYCIDS